MLVPAYLQAQQRLLDHFGVDFLDQVVDRLGVERPAFVASSMGGLWTT